MTSNQLHAFSLQLWALLLSESILFTIQGLTPILRSRWKGWTDISDIVKFENLQDRIIEIRDQKVLLDVDVAEIYGVETKRINEAVKNNPNKFPTGYVIELDKTEWDGLKSKFSTSIKGGKVKLPSTFPEKGLLLWLS